MGFELILVILNIKCVVWATHLAPGEWQRDSQVGTPAKEQLLKFLFTFCKGKIPGNSTFYQGKIPGDYCGGCWGFDLLVSHQARALLLSSAAPAGKSSELRQPWNGQSGAGVSSCVRKTPQQGTQGHRFRSGQRACAV